jgi:CheY-like chemotaxis protein
VRFRWFHGLGTLRQRPYLWAGADMVGSLSVPVLGLVVNCKGAFDGEHPLSSNAATIASPPTGTWRACSRCQRLRRHNVESMALLLRLYGREVQTALGGPAALRAARANPPEVVLLDISMPGMDGYEVARQLRRMFQGRVVIIALTAHGFEEDRRRCVEACLLPTSQLLDESKSRDRPADFPQGSRG